MCREFGWIPAYSLTSSPYHLRSRRAHESRIGGDQGRPVVEGGAEYQARVLRDASGVRHDVLVKFVIKLVIQ